MVVLAEIDALPHAQRTEPVIMLCEARAAVAVGDADRAAGSCEPGLVVPSCARVPSSLGRLWRDYRALVVGSTAAATEQLPSAYDFSMRARARSVGDHRTPTAS